MWMFVSLSNHFCSSNHAHYKACFIKVVNIFICNFLFFNCILYKLESLLYFTWIFTKDLSMIVFLWKMCFENIMVLYEILNPVDFCQSARSWKKQWRLIYNLAVTKNSKMKMFTEDESREKQRSPAKTTLIAPELAQRGSLKPWQGFCCFDEVGTASARNRPQQFQL